MNRERFNKMKVNGISWIWKWKKNAADQYEPYEITPTCSSGPCKNFPLSEENTGKYRTFYVCKNCGREYKDIEHPLLIKELIEYQIK